MALDQNCKGCLYYKTIPYSKERCCHYIFVEGKKRPCEPGDKCTVKIKRGARNEVTNELQKSEKP